MLKSVLNDDRRWTIDLETPNLFKDGRSALHHSTDGNGKSYIFKYLCDYSPIEPAAVKLAKHCIRANSKFLVPIVDICLSENSNRYYMAMQLCEADLYSYMKGKSPLSWEEARRIACDIIAGLLALQPYVHGDVSLKNVLLFQGAWCLADFETSTLITDRQRRPSRLTAPFAAPELWHGCPPSPATDVYALGCLVYALVEGRLPFTGSIDAIRAQHLSDFPLPPLAIPAMAGGLITLMLAKLPDSRPSLGMLHVVLPRT